MPKNNDNLISSPIFTVIARDANLADQVAEQLERFIVENRLQPGERLPSERDLARQFDVSRTVIREAARALAARGLLQVTSGSGTIVSTPSAQSISKSVSLLLRHSIDIDFEKVTEVRCLLEIEIAGLAAQRRTDEDLQQLETIVKKMPTLQNNLDLFAQNDVDFHLALARATHNNLFVLMLDSLSDVMLVVRKIGLSKPGTSAHGVEYHQLIFDQVRAGDMAKARQVMSEHLEKSEQIFRSGLLVEETP